MSNQIWLVTGATSGLGYALVEHILAQGDKVIACGRNVAAKVASLKSDNLGLLELDITSGQEHVKQKINSAWEIFGHIDILVNNAGMAAVTPAEEADDKFIQNMFNVNFFGQLHVTNAILPHMRAQGSGCIAFTSSSAAWAMLPFMAHYSASKAALSAFVESFAKEVRPMGIRCVAFECGGFQTQLGQPRESSGSFGSTGPAIDAYKPMFSDFVGTMMSNVNDHAPGNIAKCASAMYDIAARRGVAADKPWPVRVALGTDALGHTKQRCSEQLKLAELWEDVSNSCEREGASGAAALKAMFKYTTVLG